MTSRRSFLKAGVALAGAGGLAGGWREWAGSASVLVISSADTASAAVAAADRVSGGQRSRHLAEHDDREAILAAAREHLASPRATLVAMTSPAMTLLLGLAIRDAGARLVEDRHLAARPLLVARS